MAKAKPDGHTPLMGVVHHTIGSSVYKKLPCDFAKDPVPLTTVALVPNVLVVNASTPAKNLAEPMAMLKPAHGKCSCDSNGIGTAQHLIGTQFENSTGTELIQEPYKGRGPLSTDLLAGQILMSFDTNTPVLPRIKAGKLRPPAVTTARRSGALPDVPIAGGNRAQGIQLRHPVRGCWPQRARPRKSSTA